MRKISSIVIAIHCLAIIWMAWMGYQVKETKKARIVVHQTKSAPKIIAPPKQTPIAAAAPTQVEPPKPTPVKSPPKQTPTPTPVATPIQTPPKPAPQKKGIQAAAPKKNPPPKPSQPPGPPPAAAALLKQLEESLAKIEQQPQTPAIERSKFSAPILKIDQVIEDGEERGDGGYEAELISFLHHSLNLPEFGEVKMKLTLQNNGTCVKIQVIRAQSAKNRRYLEEQLPKLRLPPFVGLLASKKEQTFVMTFCNE